jgi:hypothetical protein
MINVLMTALGEVLLYEPRAEMHVNLHKWRISDTAEAVNLSGLDHEDVACPRLEFIAIDVPESAPFPHELHFIVRMTMGSGPLPGEGPKEERGDIHIAVIGTNEVVGAAHKRQIFLADAIHPTDPPR